MAEDGTGSHQPGPVYDDAMKILAAADLDAVLSLVGVHGHGAAEMNVELPGSTKRADLLARTPTGIVHIELVKDRSPELDLRMVEYWLRLRRQNRDVPIEQYVFVLGDDVTVPDRCVERGRTCCAGRWCASASWTRCRCWTGRSRWRSRHWRAARPSSGRRCSSEVQLIAAADPDQGRALLGAATVLASIVLPATIIDTALKEATMPILIRETPLGREIYEEGLREGEQRGLPDDERLTLIADAGALDDLQR